MLTKQILLLSVIFSLLSIAASTLRFNQKGEFTILQLTDLHFCHLNSWETAAETLAKDYKAQAFQRNALRVAKPDLVVFSGDAITGTDGVRKAGDFEKCWELVSRAIVDAKVPYAYILGNHDAEGYLNREQVIRFDQQNAWSLRKGADGIPDTCNFVLPVASSRNENELAANIWLFDSGSESCGTFGGHTWGCVEQPALDWYDYQSKKIQEKHGDNVHHLAFVHIPIPEFAEMINKDEYYGVRGEMVNCPYVNTGLFDHVKKNGDISGIFSGHDHVNNIGGWHEGVELVYGQKSGYGGYGDERGARIITLKEHYNEKGELNVTRSHYIVFENLTIATNGPSSTRKKHHDPYAYCPYLAGYDIVGYFKKLIWNFKRWLNSP